MGNTLIFRFLYINGLNYRYFYTNCSTFLKIKKRWKNKKTLKNAFLYKNKKNVYKRFIYNYVLRYVSNALGRCGFF